MILIEDLFKWSKKARDIYHQHREAHLVIPKLFNLIFPIENKNTSGSKKVRAGKVVNGPIREQYENWRDELSGDFCQLCYHNAN